MKLFWCDFILGGWKPPKMPDTSCIQTRMGSEPRANRLGWGGYIYNDYDFGVVGYQIHNIARLV